KHVVTSNLKSFLVLSSVAGRFGNAGQTDYATANELLNRLCVQLKQELGAGVGVHALCWGPWGGSSFGQGMVSPAVVERFEAMGVDLVEPEAGRSAFAAEALRPQRGPVEIVLGQGPWEEKESAPGQARSAVEEQMIKLAGGLEGPLLIASQANREGSDGRVQLHLDDRHRYLAHHQIDGRSVLPAAVALEAIAESVARLWPDALVTRVEKFQLLKGLAADSFPQILEIEGRACRSNARAIDVRILSKASHGTTLRPHYRARVILDNALSSAQKVDRLPLSVMEIDGGQFYREDLFHGPLFQVIQSVSCLSPDRLRARFERSMPERWVEGVPVDQRWIFDPGSTDGIAQLAIIWARAFRNEVALPSGIQSIERFSEKLPEQFDVEFVPDSTAGHPLIRADAWAWDEAGRDLFVVRGFEAVSSADLNRLAGQRESLLVRGQGG
ncbi:MAG: polyketide synthase dehydratase domain-containing protein, partial [Myxococcota bacterium]|nr:polyketide synthase dehydratase domain-containing protein [Myxococcota bacterium]